MYMGKSWLSWWFCEAGMVVELLRMATHDGSVAHDVVALLHLRLCRPLGFQELYVANGRREELPALLACQCGLQCEWQQRLLGVQRCKCGEPVVRLMLQGPPVDLTKTLAHCALRTNRQESYCRQEQRLRNQRSNPNHPNRSWRFNAGSATAAKVLSAAVCGGFPGLATSVHEGIMQGMQLLSAFPGKKHLMQLLPPSARNMF